MRATTAAKVPAMIRHVDVYGNVRARVRLNGKDHYLGDWDDPETKVRYDKLIERWLAGGRQPLPVERYAKPRTVSGEPTALDVWRIYTARCRKRFKKNDKPTSRMSIVKACETLLRELHPDVPADEFGLRHLREMRDKWLERTSVGTTRDYISQLKSGWAWLETEGHVCEGRTGCLQILRVEAPVRDGGGGDEGGVQAVPQADLDAVIESLSVPTKRGSGPAVADMMKVQILCAMRPAEVCALSEAFLDRTSVPDIVLFKVPWWAEKNWGKRDKNGNPLKLDPIPLGPKAMAILTPWLDRAPTPEAPAFPTRRKRFWLPGDYSDAVHDQAKKIGVPPFGVNRLRKNGSQAVKAAYGENGHEAARCRLRHAAPGVTKVYCGSDLAFACDIARKMG